MTLRNYTFTRPKAIPAIMSFCACALLFSLGAWQLQRLHWKEALIAQHDTAMQNPPRELLSIPAAELPDNQFAKVIFTGRPRPMTPIYMGARYKNNVLGYHVLLPVSIKGTKPPVTVLVNMGWFPAALRGKLQFPTMPTPFTGMIHLMGRKGPFTPDNRPTQNLWFWYDHAAMEEFTHFSLLPVVIDRLETRNPAAKEAYPVGFTTNDVHLRNDHLQYALIWFSVGIACLVIFVLYHTKPRTSA